MHKVKITKDQLRELVMASEQNPHLDELAEELPGLAFRLIKDKNEFNKKGDIIEVGHCEDNKVDFNSPFRCTTTNPGVDGDDIWQLDWFMEGLSSKYLELTGGPGKAAELLALWEEAEQFEDDASDDSEEEVE